MLADEDDRSPEVGIGEPGRVSRFLEASPPPIIVAWRESHASPPRRQAAGVSRRGAVRGRGDDDPRSAEGQVLIRNAYFSVDPYMRPRMNDVRSYVAPFTLGEAMTGGAVGGSPPRGTHATPRASGCSTSWAGASGRSRTDTALRRLDPPARPSRLRSVSSACPASRRGTGSSCSDSRRRARPCSSRGRGRGRERGGADGKDRRMPRHRQRGLRGEARVAARAGLRRGLQLPGADRARRARRAGARRDRHLLRQRRRRPPRGRDRCAPHARRVVACGSISRYNDAEPAPGPRNMFLVVTKRLRIEGFIISDHFERFGEFVREATEWVRDGRLDLSRTIVEGIENAPKAFLGLLAARTSGRCSSRSAPSSETACRLFGSPSRRRRLFTSAQRCERCAKRGGRRSLLEASGWQVEEGCRRTSGRAPVDGTDIPRPTCRPVMEDDR